MPREFDGHSSKDHERFMISSLFVVSILIATSCQLGLRGPNTRVSTISDVTQKLKLARLASPWLRFVNFCMKVKISMRHDNLKALRPNIN